MGLTILFLFLANYPFDTMKCVFGERSARQTVRSKTFLSAKCIFRQNFDRMSFNKVNKQQRFYSLPKQYKQTRRFEQTPFVGNYLQPTDLFVNLTFPVFHVKQVDDYEALPCYPYRDDAILLHHVIWDYVREVLEGHYGE